MVNIIQRIGTGNPVSYSLLTLAALTPVDYKIKIINLKQFWFGSDFSGGKLIGISCLTSTAFEAYRLADKFRLAGSKVVLGGPHVTALPLEAAEHADSIVIGEAESVWAQVIKDFENNHLQKVYKGESLEDFFTPVYDYFLHLDPRLLSLAGVHIARGCKYHCDFCARISTWLRFTKTEQVIEIIKRIKKAKRAFFIRRPMVIFRCDNIYSSPDYAKKLFKEMIPLKVSWIGNCSIDIGFDEEILWLAKESGCKRLLIGFESIYSKDYPKTSLKQIQTAEDYKIAINNIKAHKIKIFGSFIIGLDHYSHFDYLKLLWFLVRSRIWHIYLLILTPFPGTDLFLRLKKENRINSLDWRKYDILTCVFKPKQISVFSVYLWFWFIRYLTVFFSPSILFFWLLFFVSWQGGYYLSRWLLYGF
ncbi:radical SAM protein [Patescibacteria group bacterium]|nr:radical SAM protein [Patescibacteria group bacterium]